MQNNKFDSLAVLCRFKRSGNKIKTWRTCVAQLRARPRIRALQLLSVIGNRKIYFPGEIKAGKYLQSQKRGGITALHESYVVVCWCPWQAQLRKHLESKRSLYYRCHFKYSLDTTTKFMNEERYLEKPTAFDYDSL